MSNIFLISDTHFKHDLDNNNQIDKRYFCVSVEQINVTPISLDEIKLHFN